MMFLMLVAVVTILVAAFHQQVVDDGVGDEAP